MGLVLALLGLGMSVIDFFSLTEHCERAAQCLRERLKSAWRRVDDYSLFRYLGVVFLTTALLSLAGIMVIEDGTALAVYETTVFAGGLVACWAQLFLGIAIGVFHLLSLPRKGIIGSVGLLLALVGVLIEFVR
jgi:hypothetical protein